MKICKHFRSISGLTCILHVNDCKYLDPFFVDHCYYAQQYCSDFEEKKDIETKESNQKRNTNETN